MQIDTIFGKVAVTILDRLTRRIRCHQTKRVTGSRVEKVGTARNEKKKLSENFLSHGKSIWLAGSVLARLTEEIDKDPKTTPLAVGMCVLGARQNLSGQ